MKPDSSAGGQAETGGNHPDRPGACEGELVKLAVLCLAGAVRRFYDEDLEELLAYKKTLSGIERACAFRIGSYFRELAASGDFKKLNRFKVDMEFNRLWIEEDAVSDAAAGGQNGGGNALSKTVRRGSGQGAECTEQKAGETESKPKKIVPDLILHKRKSQINILACEFKTSNNKKAIEKDSAKLLCLTGKQTDHRSAGNYLIGVSVCLSPSSTKGRETRFFRAGCPLTPHELSCLYPFSKTERTSICSVL
jgi:hypothetical protein